MSRAVLVAFTVVMLCVGRIEAARSAVQSPSIAVFTQAAGDGTTAAEHREGHAVLLHSRYRVQIGNLEDGPLTVKAILSGGKEKTLFSGNLPRGSHLDLPQGGGWYDAPGEAGAIKIVAAQGAGSTEHLIYVVDAGLETDGRGWSHRVDEAGSVPPVGDAKYRLAGSPAQLSRQVSGYTKLASALTGSKEPVLRGGLGARIFRDAAPGVVLVIVDDELGAGMILNQAGQILTNWHVVRGAQNIGVMLKPPTGQRLRPTDMYEAHAKKFDEVADLAVIELDQPPANLVVLKLGDEQSIEVGSSVHAIGHPSGDYWTYTEGVISQRWPNYEWTGEDKLHHTATVIQTQTPINPGNSGGPLLDDGANVIGINSFSAPDRQGLNFAISVGEVKRFLSAGGNRLAELAPETNRTYQPQRAANCEPRQIKSFVDQKTKKLVKAIDTECQGRANLYLVSDGPDKPPEFALIDNAGDGKYDIKIMFSFNGKDDLWIFYGKRDGVPTAFGYDYAGKGKPALIVRVSAVPQ
jgi:S1-C subfamily serine protease